MQRTGRKHNSGTLHAREGRHRRRARAGECVTREWPSNSGRGEGASESLVHDIVVMAIQHRAAGAAVHLFCIRFGKRLLKFKNTVKLSRSVGTRTPISFGARFLLPRLIRGGGRGKTGQAQLALRGSGGGSGPQSGA